MTTTTFTVAQLLDQHNQLAELLGLPVRHKWHDTKAKLAALVADLDAKEQARHAKDANVFRIADLAREFGKNAKVLRAKARRLLADDKLPAPSVRDNAYHVDQRAAVVAALGLN